MDISKKTYTSEKQQQQQQQHLPSRRSSSSVLKIHTDDEHDTVSTNSSTSIATDHSGSSNHRILTATTTTTTSLTNAMSTNDMNMKQERKEEEEEEEQKQQQGQSPLQQHLWIHRPIQQQQKQELKSRSKTKNSRIHSRWWAIIIMILIVFLDCFLLFIPLVCYSVWSIGFRYIHDTYIMEQRKLMRVVNSKDDPDYETNNNNNNKKYRDVQNEITYYERYCAEETDITTLHAEDLWIDGIYNNNTMDNEMDYVVQFQKEEMIHHQMKHGVTVFSNVLTTNTIQQLRSYIDYKNKYSPTTVGVIENEYRISHLLSPTENIPHENKNNHNNHNQNSVAIALEEIANHLYLQTTMEGILGPNAALTELTAITSSFGAKDQYWHDDISHLASGLNYVHTFGSFLSIFIPLQDTTIEMGATYVCPGTHYCSDGPLTSLCDEYGIPVAKLYPNRPTTVTKNHNETSTDPATKYWAAGDALVMNSNIQHRGAGHTDEMGIDRIVFMLTFTNRPPPLLNGAVQVVETKQMPHGSTYTLRWDLWGHTWSDLQSATILMTQPFYTTLRSLGWYKLPKTTWGISYIDKFFQLYDNQGGYNYDEVILFIKNGGYHPYLPWFLHGYISMGIDFYEFALDTQAQCEMFILLCIVTALYVYYRFTKPLYRIIQLNHPQYNNNKNQQPHGLHLVVLQRWQKKFIQPFRQLYKFISSMYWILSFTMIGHLMIICLFITVLIFGIKYQVDHSGWARDIRSGRRYNSIASIHAMYYQLENTLPSPTLYRKTDDTMNYFRESTNHNNDNNNSSVLYPNQNTKWQRHRIQATVPTKYDVLIETRFDVENVGFYNNIIDYHPGNQILHQYLSTYGTIHNSTTTAKSATTTTTTTAVTPGFWCPLNDDNLKTSSVMNQMALFITRMITYDHQGRFLLQVPNGKWSIMTDVEATQYVLELLALQCVPPIVRHLRNDIRYLLGQNKYGIYRDSVLIMDHSVPFLLGLRNSLWSSPVFVRPTMVRTSDQHVLVPPSLSPRKLYFVPQHLTIKNLCHFPSRQRQFQNTNHVKQRLPRVSSIIRQNDEEPTEPYVGAWLKERDHVEAQVDGDYWYLGILKVITADGRYTVNFGTGEDLVLSLYQLRPFEPYQSGETIYFRPQDPILGDDDDDDDDDSEEDDDDHEDDSLNDDNDDNEDDSEDHEEESKEETNENDSLSDENDPADINETKLTDDMLHANDIKDVLDAVEAMSLYKLHTYFGHINNELYAISNTTGQLVRIPSIYDVLRVGDVLRYEPQRDGKGLHLKSYQL